MSEKKVSNEVNDNTSQGNSPAEETPSVSIAPEELSGKINSLEEQIKKQNQAFASMRQSVQSAQEERDRVLKELAEARSQQTTTGSSIDDDDDDLDPDTRKTLDSYLKKRGVITQEELRKREEEKFLEQQKNLQKVAVKDFLASHPEYDNDEMWSKVEQESALYKTPTTKEGFNLMFNRIHQNISNSMGIPQQRGADRARAELLNRSLMAKGGSSGISGDTTNSASYVDRYKNVSSEQLEKQIQELKRLGYDPSGIINK